MSVTLGALVWRLPRNEGLVFNFYFGKWLRSSSHAVVVRPNLDCPEICAVNAMADCSEAARSLR